MTLVRAPGSPKAAVIEAIGKLPADAISETVGKTVDHLYKVSHPSARVGLHFEDAARLDALLEAYGHAPLFGPIFEEAKERTLTGLGGSRREPVNLLLGLTAATEKFGGLAGVIRKALADGKVTPAEQRGIAQAYAALKAEVQALGEAVEPAENVVALACANGGGR